MVVGELNFEDAGNGRVARVAAAAVGVRSTGYLESYDFYAEKYSVSLRTVKRWVDTGKKAADFTPLDDPEDFQRWWTEHMGKVAPEGLLKALVEWRKTFKPDAVSVVMPAAAEVEEIAVEDSELGLEPMLRRLETMEVRLSRKATDPGGSKPWLDTISRITSVITRLREEKEKHGKLIPKDMAEGMIHEFHGPVESGVRGMGSEFCREAGLPWGSKQEAAWAAVCDTIFRRFGEGVFGGL